MYLFKDIWVPSHNIRNKMSYIYILHFILPWFHFLSFHHLEYGVYHLICIYILSHIYLLLHIYIKLFCMLQNCIKIYCMSICNMLFQTWYMWAYLMIKYWALSPCCIIFHYIKILPWISLSSLHSDENLNCFQFFTVINNAGKSFFIKICLCIYMNVSQGYAKGKAHL